MPTPTELLHYRLQAVLRDYNMPDLEYIGDRPSYKTGDTVPVSYTHLTLPTICSV